MKTSIKWLVAAFACFCASPALFAQWTTQTLSLRPGWNAVFLEVQPADNRCETVLSGLPVETVWRWNRRYNSVQFISDPNQLIREPDAWLIWMAQGISLAGRSSLSTLDGGRAYLIKTTNSTTINWNIRGTPVRNNVEWVADSLVLAGFHLAPTNTATFQSYFGGATGLTNASLYRLNASGIWSLAAVGTTMQRGEAFWVRPQGLPAFQGPLEVQLAESKGLNFGNLLSEHRLSIYNASSSIRSVVVRQLDSEVPPAGSGAALAGSVPLSCWQNDFALGRAGWTNLPSQLSSNIPPGGAWEIRLAVRRADMVAYSPPPGVSNYLYQTLLEVAESSSNFRQLVPVTAEGARSGPVNAKDLTPPDPRAGLWIGQVAVNKVSQPASASPGTPIPAASEFSFRLLVHVDSGGQARLLQKVLQMWSPGTYKPANDGTTNLVVDQPGRFVLLTDEGTSSQYTGAALRDGRPVARRFSSAAFAFRNPLAMTGVGSFGTAASQFSCNVTNDYRDPLNPFVHSYHPDHNNMDERYSAVLPEGRESYTVTRLINLNFSSQDPDNLAIPGWGDNRLGGVYRETISGLHKAPLNLEGTFSLTRASTIPELN